MARFSGGVEYLTKLLHQRLERTKYVDPRTGKTLYFYKNSILEPGQVGPADSNKIHLRDGTVVTVGEWKMRQKIAREMKDAERPTAKEVSAQALEKRHNEMIQENPVSYFEMYAYTELDPNNPNTLVSQKLMKEYLDSALAGKLNDETEEERRTIAQGGKIEDLELSRISSTLEKVT